MGKRYSIGFPKINAKKCFIEIKKQKKLADISAGFLLYW